MGCVFVFVEVRVLITPIHAQDHSWEPEVVQGLEMGQWNASQVPWSSIVSLGPGFVLCVYATLEVLGVYSKFCAQVCLQCWGLNLECLPEEPVLSLLSFSSPGTWTGQSVLSVVTVPGQLWGSRDMGQQ